MNLPKLFELLGYSIYFWSNENNEPVHIHISKGMATANSTKMWILESGSVLLENNKSKIPSKDLKKLMKVVQLHSNEICAKWRTAFGNEIKYYI